MTTEDDFQAALDANPDDWQTRLVFADWLRERDDPRADGVRAVVALGKRPFGEPPHGPPRSVEWYDEGREGSTGIDPASDLPSDWFVLLNGFLIGSTRQQRTYRNPADAEQAAIRAFAKLPGARRAELLGAVAV